MLGKCLKKDYSVSETYFEGIAMTKSRLLKTLLTVLILAALGCGGYYLYSFYVYTHADIRKAALNGSSKQLEAIIGHGGDVNAVDEQGRPVLFLAMRAPENRENILLLINNGADTNKLYNQVSPLTMALATLDDAEIIKALLAKGSNVNYYGLGGNTPLMLAAGHQTDPKVIRELLDYGAKINAVNDDGQTALMFAAVNNPNPEVLKTLLEAGAAVNLEDQKGNTAFILASLKLRDNRYLDLLSEYGADIYHKNREGKDALMLVEEVSKEIDTLSE